jgi:hypothetical protein
VSLTIATPRDVVVTALKKGVVAESWVSSMCGADVTRELLTELRAVEVVTFSGATLHGWWSTSTKRLVQILGVVTQVVPCSDRDLRALLGDLPIPADIPIDVLLSESRSPVRYVRSADVWVVADRYAADVIAGMLQEANCPVSDVKVAQRLPADAGASKSQALRDSRLTYLKYLGLWSLTEWLEADASTSTIEVEIVSELLRVKSLHRGGGLDALIVLRGRAEVLERLIEHGRVGVYPDGSYGLVSDGARPLVARGDPKAVRRAGPQAMYSQSKSYCTAVAAISRDRWAAVLEQFWINPDGLRLLETRVLRELRVHLQTPEIEGLRASAVLACQPHANWLRRRAQYETSGAIKALVPVIEIIAGRGSLAVAVACLGSPGLGRELYAPLECAIPWHWGLVS